MEVGYFHNKQQQPCLPRAPSVYKHIHTHSHNICKICDFQLFLHRSFFLSSSFPSILVRLFFLSSVRFFFYLNRFRHIKTSNHISPRGIKMVCCVQRVRSPPRRRSTPNMNTFASANNSILFFLHFDTNTDTRRALKSRNALVEY